MKSRLHLTSWTRNLVLLIIATAITELFGLPIAKAESNKISAEHLQWLNDRSPSIFTVFSYYKKLYELRRPYFLIDLDLTFRGGKYTHFDVASDGQIHESGDATVLFVQAGVGSVFYQWDKGALRFGNDVRAFGTFEWDTNSEDSTIESKDIVFTQELFYLGYFYKKWSVTAGLSLKWQPEFVSFGSLKVFSEDREIIPGGFLYFSAPYFGGGVVIDKTGISSGFAKSPIDIFTGIVGEFGPFLNFYPTAGNYQPGVYADEITLYQKYLRLSAETALRYEGGLSLNHAQIKLLSSFGADFDYSKSLRQSGQTTSFSINISAGGSYINLPKSSTYSEINQPFGGGGEVEAVWSGGWDLHLVVGASYNYYASLIILPLPNDLLIHTKIMFLI
jgi:hypothetical protein